MGFWKQVGALMKKDLQVAKRSKVGTCCEVVFPLFMGLMAGLFLLLVALIQHLSGGPDEGLTLPNPVLWNGWLGVTPPDNVIGQELVQFIDTFPFFARNETSGTPRRMNASVFGYQNVANLSGLVQGYKAADAMVAEDEYVSFAGLQAHGPRNFTIYGANHKYGLIGSFMMGIASTMYAQAANFSFNPGVNQLVQKNPTSKNIYFLMNFRAVFSSSGVGLLLYGFIPAVILTGGRLVDEKKNRVRESLKVMAVSDSAYLVSNFFSAFLRMGVGTSLISLVLAVTTAIPPEDIPIVMGLGCLFALSLIAYAQIMPSLFSVNLWSNVFVILFLWGSATLCAVSTGFPLPMQLVCCLLSPVAFYYSLLPLLSQGSVILTVTQPMAIGMMAFDAVLYLVLGQYIYAVAPGEFGAPKHPLFFLGFGRKRRHDAGLASPTKKNSINDLDSARTEEMNGNGTAPSRVILDSLYKYYGNNHDNPAVNGLNMEIRQGEIFALLGHNGAGKTTTISILTGMITASDYVTSTIDGMDITRDIGQIRKNIGLCPQFDVLFNDLTAREHLELFARIKGKEHDKERIDYLLNELELLDDTKPASKFSGGMRRRLSVGNALVGGASLVFLDEPSSGMDPLNRRRMWNLLKEERKLGKTIVLTTHFMEEADYLGDRIAIMSHGKLYCCDTSQRLKETHGVGFYLSMVKPALDAHTAKVEDARALIAKQVAPYPVTLHQDTSGDATFMLPTGALPHFGQMLSVLEDHLDSLNFHSYGVSMNTLEDVFVTISKKEDDARKKELEEAERKRLGDLGERTEEALHNSMSLDTSTVANRPVANWFDDAQKVAHSERVKYQAKAIFRRKCGLLARSRRMQLMTILFPLAFIFLAFATLQPQPQAVGLLFDGEEDIKFDDLELIWINMNQQETTNRIRTEFEKVYNETYPHSKLRWMMCADYDDYTSGAYIPVHSLNFFKGIPQPPYPGGFFFHAVDLTASKPYANYTMLFNSKFKYGAAATFSSMMNTAIERTAGNTDADLYVHFEPEVFPDHVTANGTAALVIGDDGTKYGFMNVGVYSIIAVVQLVANCVLPVVDEVQRGVYHSLRAHGMTASAYFIGNLAFDAIVLVYPFLLFTAGVYIKGVGAFDSSVIVLVLIAGLLFGCHVIMHAYIIAFKKSEVKPVMYTAMLQGMNLAMLGAPYMIDLSIKSWASSFAETIKPYLLSIFPPCSFYHILDNTSDMTSSNSSPGYIWTFTGIRTGFGFIFLVLELIVPFLVLRGIVLEKRTHRRLKKDKNSKAATVTKASKAAELATEEKPLLSTPVPRSDEKDHEDDEDEPLDIDVFAEANRVATCNRSDNMIAVKKLLKCFGYTGNVKVAVNETSFGIKRGECFGLLGPNGAGKTTTCKCILKAEDLDDGEIDFTYTDLGPNATRDEEFLQCRLGLCSQGDTLWEHLTAAEHMDHYLAMRLTTLYDKDKWAEYIKHTIAKVQLDEAGEKHAGGYSGGMKRKLAVSIAMYTGAQAIFLDEPSTGMDPFARRALWQVILEALSQDRAVLLTTHSMEEADAVCARIAIMTSGVMRCIGSSQHLKNRFGSGYVVSLTVDPEADTEELDKKVIEFFGKDAELKEAIGTQRRYSVGTLPSLAKAFSSIESHREEWHVTQYSVAQTSSLEQIFLNFVGTEAPEEDK